MNIFEEWWHKEDYVLKSVCNGILVDDLEVDDCVIHNNDMLENFKQNIALNMIITKFVKDNIPDFEFTANIYDGFLNEKIKIDFKSEILIIIISAEIKHIVYSTQTECYYVILKETRVEKNCYSAGVCVNRIKSGNLKFCILNLKPEVLKIDRPVISNDEY
jgi:hypothetical protein